MKTSVILPAGGMGLRSGAASPKQFVMLGNFPMYEYSLNTFLSHPHLSTVILVVPTIYVDEVQTRWKNEPRVSVVAGGSERWLSVQNGFNALDRDTYGVLIHDVARPFVDHAVIDRCINSITEGNCCVAALRTVDTTKEVIGQIVVQTLDRKNLISVQTPQAFPYDVLSRMYAYLKNHSDQIPAQNRTDEAGMVEAMGEQVVWVEGSSLLQKVTTASDLKWAEWVSSQKTKAEN